MTTVDATSEVFMTAFRALPKKAREAVVSKVLKEKEFREDLMDPLLSNNDARNRHGLKRSISRTGGRRADVRYTVYLKRSAEKELRELAG